MNLFQQYFVDTLKNNYANFEGRARRSEYWYFTLFSFLISIAFSVLTVILGSTIGGIVSIISMIFSLAIFVPSIALGVRRLHDIGKPGWWFLIILIPLIGIIVLIVFFVTDSQPGTNMYGPNPKNSNPLDEVRDQLIVDDNV